MENKRFCRAVAEEIEGKLLAIASDETVDREGEILSIDGWDLKDFKRNPIMLWSHSHLDFNIGRAKGMGFKDINGKKKLVFEPEFHDETELSRTAHRLFDRGFLKTFSVGFLPTEMESNKFTRQTLLEVSLVNVPANANAEVINMAYELENAYVKSIDEIKTIKVNKTVEGKEEEQNEEVEATIEEE